MTKQMKLRRTLFGSCLAAALLAFTGGSVTAEAGSLENMERERAILVATLLDSGLSADERHQKSDVALRRLVDLERIALRDPKLKNDTSAIVRRAFNDYDLTFLAHASIERGMGALDLWLERTGVSTARLMSARAGLR